jgi:mitochondrial ATPase complex subunit ATP10
MLRCQGIVAWATGTGPWRLTRIQISSSREINPSNTALATNVIMKSSDVQFFRSFALSLTFPCRQCQRRLLHSSRRLHQTASPNNGPDLTPLGLPKVDIAPKRQIAPRMLKKDFEAKPLGAPVGVNRAPRPSDDPVADFQRSMAAKSKDWAGRLDSNTATRQHLLKTMDRSHVRDYKNITNAKGGGKFYLANPKLYRSNISLYWPNLKGRTLASEEADTTTLLKGWISVVCLFQRQWALAQTRTYVGSKEHPELAKVIKENQDVAQILDISMEDLAGFSLFARMFEWNLRRGKTKEEQQRYFVTSNIPVVIKESLAVMNNSVGYVFLVDEDCKIRWSACAQASPEEKDSLINGITSMIERSRSRPSYARKANS